MITVVAGRLFVVQVCTAFLSWRCGNEVVRVMKVAGLPRVLLPSFVSLVVAAVAPAFVATVVLTMTSTRGVIRALTRAGCGGFPPLFADWANSEWSPARICFKLDCDLGVGV